LDVLREFSKYGEAYDETNLATTWSRLGRARGTSLSLLQSHEGERLHALRERSAQEAERWSARGLANTAHALAKLRLRSGQWRDLWLALAAGSHREMSAFSPQGLSNTVWAFATAGRAAPALLDAIAAEAAPRVGKFNSQELANMAWSYATAGHAHRLAPHPQDWLRSARSMAAGLFASAVRRRSFLFVVLRNV